MAFTYDPTTDRGRVRLLATDRDEATAIFADDEIDAFLAMESSSVRLAAAVALETIAADQALVLKVVKTLDLETDGAKVANTLMERARRLREAEERDPAGSFDIAEQVFDQFSQTERWNKYAQRTLP